MFSQRLDPALKAKINEIAKRQNRTISNVIETAVKEYIAKTELLQRDS